MALFYRKRIRDFVLGLLSNTSTGFNATLQAQASVYGILPFALDWTAGSRDVALSFIAPDEIDLEASQLLDFPAIAIYTTQATDIGEPRGVPFVGEVILAIDFYVRLREGAEQNTEDVMDAVEDSVVSVLNNPAVIWPPGVLYNRKTKIDRMPLMHLADGFQQITRIESQFGSASTSL